jgi:hypothetical protein
VPSLVIWVISDFILIHLFLSWFLDFGLDFCWFLIFSFSESNVRDFSRGGPLGPVWELFCDNFTPATAVRNMKCLDFRCDGTVGIFNVL